ncbi:hypothetical protein ACFSC4_13695 [Deinococcus malanensis]|uniref:hypothetical protein n=1 Tax=Deinococcus malanensis TaxID=1706855 RepID=UPI00363E46C7
MSAQPALTTAKGATIEARTAYSVLQGLKGHEAPEYAVTREELGALNARAVADLESSDALRAFADTLTRIGAASGAPPPTRPQNGLPVPGVVNPANPHPASSQPPEFGPFPAPPSLRGATLLIYSRATRARRAGRQVCWRDDGPRPFRQWPCRIRPFRAQLRLQAHGPRQSELYYRDHRT